MNWKIICFSPIDRCSLFIIVYVPNVTYCLLFADVGDLLTAEEQDEGFLSVVY